jgi:hypothetical protein
MHFVYLFFLLLVSTTCIADTLSKAHMVAQGAAPPGYVKWDFEDYRKKRVMLNMCLM